MQSIPDECSSPRVLVVEADPQVRERSLKWLRGSGLSAHAVDNGVEALRYLLGCRSHPALMVVGVDLPHLDGFSLLKLMKLQPDLAVIPFVMSGIGEDWIARARQLGAFACLPEPFEQSQLLALSGRWASRPSTPEGSRSRA
jgi:chemosensory pili system protein ChpA (sensor histidine kinase/response regulator)